MELRRETIEVLRFAQDDITPYQHVKHVILSEAKNLLNAPV